MTSRELPRLADFNLSRQSWVREIDGLPENGEPGES